MSNTVESLISDILLKESDQKFYSFVNNDGKEWIMPARNMQIAMNLYQPSGRNGKLLKSLFPNLHWCSIVRRILHAKECHYVLRKDIYELICSKFSENDIEFALFGGTPCVHQKITIQISKDKRIIGYCKICNNDEIFRLFKSEERVLNELHSKGVVNIPECLFCGHLSDGIGLFLQTTIKTNRSKIVHEWDENIDDFIQNLYEKSKQIILFEESDYYKTLLSLKNHLFWLPDIIDKNLIENSIEIIFSENISKNVEYAACHADFTPWNMFIEGNRIFVFDFEYASLTYPIGLDRYHFFTQTSYFEKHWDSDNYIAYINSDKGTWIDKKLYIKYLVDIIARFTVRENAKVSVNVQLFELWFNLLKYLLK